MSNTQADLEIAEVQLKVLQERREEMIKNRAGYSRAFKGWDFFHLPAEPDTMNETMLIINNAEIMATQLRIAHLRAVHKTEQPRLAQLPQ